MPIPLHKKSRHVLKTAVYASDPGVGSENCLRERVRCVSRVLIWLHCDAIQRRRSLNRQTEIFFRSSTSCIEYKPGDLSLSQ